MAILAFPAIADTLNVTVSNETNYRLTGLYIGAASRDDQIFDRLQGEHVNVNGSTYILDIACDPEGNYNIAGYFADGGFEHDMMYLTQSWTCGEDAYVLFDRP
jgi:hypothetical protein